jgi:membrane protein
LAIELLAAVAIRLAQRHVKSWSSTLIVQINNSPDGPAPLSSSTKTGRGAIPELDDIWDVKPKPGSGLWGFVRARFLSFAMVGGVCFLLLVSLTVESILRGLSDYLKAMMPGGHVLALALFLVFDLLVIILLFALIFRYLPDAKVAWRDVWVGATLTAVLFVFGKFVLALYLGSGAAGSAYGAASSLITLLLWIYYAAQILLFGAEFTQVYANTYGTLVQPKKHAVKVERTEREVTL